MSTNHILFPPLLTYTDDARVPVGTEYDDGYGRVYEYVRFTRAVTYVRGQTLSWDSPVPGTRSVTNDESLGNDIPAGVLPTQARTATALVPTENQYGWMQKKGDHPAVKKSAGDDTWASGDAVILHASADGEADPASDANEPTAADRARMIGRCTGDDEATTTGTYDEDTVPVKLNIPHG
ncbi:MAG: hypothetical protein ACREQL_13290 [Candidatus Binatia bacterium]